MKLEISIPQIVCHRTTLETSPDEIYFAYFVAAGKKDDEGSGKGKLLGRHLSAVERKVERGHRWKPGEATVVEVDDDAEVVGVMFAMYEKDNGEIREQLKTATAPIDSPEPWKNIDLPASTSWQAWAKAVFKFLIKLLRQIPRDDEIGRREVSINPRDEYALGTRSFDLKGFGGKYTVTLDIRDVG